MAPTKTPNASRGTIHAQSSQQVVSFTIRARPLHPPILQFILDNLSILKTLQHNMQLAQRGQKSNISEGIDPDVDEDGDEVDKYSEVVRKPTVGQDQFWDGLKEVCKKAGSEWEEMVDKIWAFGPQKAGGCILVDARKHKAYASCVQFYLICGSPNSPLVDLIWV